MSLLMEGAAIVVVAGGVGAAVLWKFGLLGKAVDSAEFKVGQRVDNILTPLEKEQLSIKKLTAMLDEEANQVTDLDAQFATQNDRLRDLQVALTGKVQDLRDTPEASGNDQVALQHAAAAVASAEQAVATQAALVEGLKGQATQAHDAYESSLAIVRKRQSELPAAQATVILTKATQVATSIQKQNEALTTAEKIGEDNQTAIRNALHKAEAEANLHGPSTDQKALDALKAKRATDDVLARYGMAPATPSTPAAG